MALFRHFGFAGVQPCAWQSAQFVGTMLVSKVINDADTNMLTDAQIRKFKPAEKPRKLSDFGGLHLLVQPTGSKLWRWSYRLQKKQKTLALGVYPRVGLKEAREKRDQARRALESGVDPAAQRKAAKLAGSIGNTFKEIAEELVVKKEAEGRSAKTIKKLKWLLEFAYPSLGDLPIRSISATELLATLRTLEERGVYETARRLRSTCGMVFRYAIVTGRTDRDPSVSLYGALTTPTVKHRAAIVDPKGIGELLRAIDGFSGQYATKAALQLSPLLFVRPGELRNAEWNEFDLEKAEWQLPAQKMKMRRPHKVPLARQAIEIIERLRKITGSGQYLFPSIRSNLRPMSDNTVNAALRRLGYSNDEITSHGFRSMASTRLNEMGKWNADAIERQLAHQESDDVRRAYMHAAEYWSERVKMMQEWADYLDELRANISK